MAIDNLSQGGDTVSDADQLPIGQASSGQDRRIPVSVLRQFVQEGMGATEILAKLADTADQFNGDALVGVKQPFPGAVARTQHDKNAESISVDDFYDGISADNVMVQKAVDALELLGGGTVIFPRSSYVFENGVEIPSRVRLLGRGTTIFHPASPGFRVKNEATTGSTDILVDGFTFDAGGTWSGCIDMRGVSRLTVQNCHFKNIKITDVTVGVGIAGTAAVPNCSDIKILNNTFDCPDYGVVFDATAAGALIENVVVSGNVFGINWGSAISFAGNISKGTISSNIIRLLANIPSQLGELGVGIGVKLWQGTNENAAPRNISIVGNEFVGNAVRTEIAGISAANFTNNLTVSANTFKACTWGFYNNFSGIGGVNNIAFCNNMVKECDVGYNADTSSDVEPIITGNSFRNVTTGITTILRGGIIANNKINGVIGKAIHLISPSAACVIANNVIRNVGQEAIFMAGSGLNNDSCSITNNVIHDCCTSADNTYNVIQLNNNPHVVSGNTISTTSSTVKPIWIIGSPVGSDRRLINSNWMFGARSGYRQIAGGFDVYQGNLERGGIG